MKKILEFILWEDLTEINQIAVKIYYSGPVFAILGLMLNCFLGTSLVRRLI